ncbi:hypothetical protein JTB14_003962 [Gonioctena quinquepunctata]|nr:hypothetical protein JTB14_003962 [Gonioctena quinquepunctata]
MSHDCSLEFHKRSWRSLSGTEASFGKYRRKLLGLLVISNGNPLTVRYFKSEASIREEKRRQIFSKFPYVIHPYSKFRIWYEIYIFIVYAVVLLLKPVDVAVISKASLPFPTYDLIVEVLDILCILDIFINFLTGFERTESKTIELRPSKIAKHYVLGPYFFCDVIASISRNSAAMTRTEIIHYWVPARYMGLANGLKVIRVITLVQSVSRIFEYLSIKFKGLTVFVQVILMMIFIMHWLSFIQIMIPRLVMGTVPSAQRTSWLYKERINKMDFYRKCMLIIFKGTSTIVGIETGLSKMYGPLDNFLSLSIFWLGRMVMSFVWVILAIAILRSRSIEIKYQSILVEVETYLKAKMIPMALRNKIHEMYEFVHRQGLFQNNKIDDLMSTTLKQEFNLFELQKLIQSVTILSELPKEVVKNVVSKLKMNIYMPNETILHSGAIGSNMYFISSGTVAVYTHSGREVCHLHDGDYFGESALVIKGQKRHVTIIAIEISQIYSLSGRTFQKLFRKYPSIYNKIVSTAEKKAQIISEMEMAYKRKHFKENIRHSSSETVA